MRCAPVSQINRALLWRARDGAKQERGHIQKIERIVSTDSPRRLILASQSPRRIQLLRDAGYAFDVSPADIDGVEYVVITAGSLDILAEVVAADDEQLLNILTRIRSVPTVISTEIFLYLKLRKQTYAWGTR